MYVSGMVYIYGVAFDLFCFVHLFDSDPIDWILSKCRYSRWFASYSYIKPTHHISANSTQIHNKWKTYWKKNKTNKKITRDIWQGTFFWVLPFSQLNCCKVYTSVDNRNPTNERKWSKDTTISSTVKLHF